MFRATFVFVLAISCGGCAELFLEERIGSIASDPVATGSEITKTQPNSVTMPMAIAYSLNMSEAYNQAARNSAIAQDVTAGLLILAAASTALGAIEEVSDQALARRATAAVTVQQVGQRGLPRDAIKSLYLGARQTNCIANIAVLNSDIRSDRAGLVTVLFIKDIEYRVREGIVRDIPEFSELQSAIAGASSNSNKLAPDSDPNAISLVEYVTALQGCLNIKALPDT